MVRKNSGLILLEASFTSVAPLAGGGREGRAGGREIPSGKRTLRRICVKVTVMK